MGVPGAEPGRPAPDSHAFVVRVWREDGGPRPVWRGRITHVGSGAQCGFVGMRQLRHFIYSYVEQLQVSMPVVWRLRRRLARLLR